MDTELIIIVVVIVVIIALFVCMFIFMKDKFKKEGAGDFESNEHMINSRETERDDYELITRPEDFLRDVTNNGKITLKINHLVFETLCNKIERIHAQMLNGTYNVARYNEIVRRINNLSEIRITNAIRYPFDLDHYPVQNVINSLTNLQNIGIFTGIHMLTFCYVDVNRYYAMDNLIFVSKWNDEYINKQVKAYISGKHNNHPYKIQFETVKVSGRFGDVFDSELYMKDDKLVF
jgi:hypothetical protein